MSAPVAGAVTLQWWTRTIGMYAVCWLGLVKEVLPSKDSCWLASANGAVASLSPAERRYRLYCPAQNLQQQQWGS